MQTYMQTYVSNQNCVVQETNSQDHLQFKRVTFKEARVLLSFLKTDPKSKRQGILDSKSASDIIFILSSYERLAKLMNDDIKIILRIMKILY